jgi:serine/threonine-protein kinase
LSALAVLPPIGRIGRYDVLGKLATGGVAEIYVGRMTGPQDVSRLVVLKRIHPGLSESSVVKRDFLHEARLMLRLSHPNLVAVHDVGEDDAGLFLAMEWVRGPSLRKVVEAAKARGGMPIPLVVSLFADLAGALHHVHTATDEAGRPLRIVHRDVNPENVVIGWGGIAKLLDFGVAKSDESAKKTDAGVVKGKYGYMAPEQWNGEAVDARSDLFALAVTLHEALTGQPLYERPTPMATMAAIVLEPEAPSVRETRPEVPEALDRIVRRGLAKKPDERYASAAELRADLEKVASAFSPEAHAGQAKENALARHLEALFPGESRREPVLDRKPPSVRFVPVAVRAEPTPLDLQLAAEAELEGDAMLREQRSRARVVALLVALVVIGTIAFVVVNLR